MQTVLALLYFVQLLYLLNGASGLLYKQSYKLLSADVAIPVAVNLFEYLFYLLTRLTPL